MNARQDPSSALGKAQHSLDLRRASRTSLNPPGKIIGNNSEAAPNRAKRGGAERGDLREARGSRADKEPSLRRVRISAEAQAPEEAAGATIAIATR